jgi:dolichol-phosphate mannosyltransferase
MDLSIVIPCFNEAANVCRLEQQLLPVVRAQASLRSVEVIFVDDGSTDGTAQALDDTFGNRNEPPHFTFVVARHRTNRGLGAALRSGFAAAQGQVVVTTDSDGTYAFSEIPVLLSYLGPEIDVVTASLHHPAGGVDGVAAYRVLLSRGASAIYRLLVDWQLHTYTALFRAIRRRVIEQVVVESDGFLAVTEFLVKARLMGFRIAEYPAVLRTRAAGESKLRTTRVVLAHLGFQRRVLMHRLHVMDLVDRRRTPGSRESV